MENTQGARDPVLLWNRPHFSCWEDGSMIKLTESSLQLGRWKRKERLGDGSQEGRRSGPRGGFNIYSRIQLNLELLNNPGEPWAVGCR